MKTTLTISVKAIPSVLAILAKTLRPTILIGDPGIGKTAQVFTFRDTYYPDANVATLVAAAHDRLDFTGLPFVEAAVSDSNGKVTRFAPLSIFRELSKEHNPNGAPTILYFNEVNAAPESALIPLYRLFAERAIGDIKLRDNVIMIADGNPVTAKSAGREMQFAFRRRFNWIFVDTDRKEWLDWAAENGVTPYITTFLNANLYAQHFFDFDPKKIERYTFACPATWVALSTVFKDLEAFDLQSDSGKVMAIILASAIVGPIAAPAFVGWLAMKDSIKGLKQIFVKPESFEWNREDVNILTTIAAYVAAEVVNDIKKFKQIAPFTKKFLEDNTEYAVFMLRNIAHSVKGNKAKAKAYEAALTPLIPALSRHPDVVSALVHVTLN